MLREDCLLRSRRARLKFGRASSSLAWPTPDLTDVHRGGRQTTPEIIARRVEGGHQVSLEGAATLWPTPDAKISNDGEDPETFFARARMHADKEENPTRAGATLAIAAQVWPTPAKRDYRTPNSQESQETRNEDSARGQQLNNFVEHLWSSPKAADGRAGPDFAKVDRSTTGDALPAQTALWSTPSVADTTGGRTSRSGDRADEILLNGQSEAVSKAIWSSPRVQRGPWQRDNGDPEKQRLTLEGEAAAFSPQDPTTSPDGSPSSPSTRRLNPRFVEHLMGWPEGWTRFGCSETQLSLWKRQSRSELLRIGLSQPVAQQFDLFG